MNQKPEVAKTKTILKLRIISGVTFVFLSIVLTLSFISYLMKWKADQSRAGTMLDKSIKSSNVFGKIGDWLGNFFIFESIGIAGFIVAFLLFVFGTLILKKIISSHGRLFLIACFLSVGCQFSWVLLQKVRVYYPAYMVSRLWII